MLVTQPPGYLLRVEPESVDGDRFEAAVAEGRRLLDGARTGDDHGRLTDSPALWRGPALADFAYEEFAEREATRLEELRLVVLKDRLRASRDFGPCHRSGRGPGPGGHPPRCVSACRS